MTHKEPTADDCLALLSELRLTPAQGCVGITADGFFVMIFAKAKRPALVKFCGWPVEYHIGGGMPIAYAGVQS